jgi:hypothetical protein
MWEEPGAVVTLLVGAFLLTLALTVDFPRAAIAFQSDESTYYVLGHSLAEDFDFEYRREDLVRVWREFPSGPQGIFLKEGKDIEVGWANQFPFVTWVKHDDAARDTRLYFAKAFAYPLAATPFIFFFGTNGFLVLHAILLTLDLAAAYAFLRARTSPMAALAYSIAFFLASAVPVYFVWLTPELFNLSLVLLGLFLWCYKEVARPLVPSAHLKDAWGRFLRSDSSTWLGAALIGVAAFSKPTNGLCILPVLALPLLRRQWKRVLLTGVAFAVAFGGLLAMNAAVSGEFNYQGGYRSTFYADGTPNSGFPFLTPGRTFRNTGLTRTTNAVPTEVLVNRNALLRVFPSNLAYFTLGRHTGLVPYFFPGVLSLLLFLWAGRRRRESFQWLVAATVVAGSLALMLYMPFTYSGGGAPVGNRYFMGYYALFLFVTPALVTVRAALVAMLIGGLFCAQLIANPFFTSFYPWVHPQRGLFRLLPAELSLVNDLPVNVVPSRVKQRLGGEPPALGYFLDDRAYALEDEGWFWVRGASKTEVVLRAPVKAARGRVQSLEIAALDVELESGPRATTARIATNEEGIEVDLPPGTLRKVRVAMGSGLPYMPFPDEPMNQVYRVTISSSDGFFPMFSGLSRDNRFLGVRVRITPVYR